MQKQFDDRLKEKIGNMMQAKLGGGGVLGGLRPKTAKVGGSGSKVRTNSAAPISSPNKKYSRPLKASTVQNK